MVAGFGTLLSGSSNREKPDVGFGAVTGLAAPPTRGSSNSEAGAELAGFAAATGTAGLTSKSEEAAGEEPKREELAAPNTSLEAPPKMSAAGFAGLGDASEAIGALRSTAAAGASKSAALAPPANSSAVAGLAADLAGFEAPRPRGSKSEEEDAGLVSFTSSANCVYVSKRNTEDPIRVWCLYVRGVGQIWGEMISAKPFAKAIQLLPYLFDHHIALEW